VAGKENMIDKFHFQFKDGGHATLNIDDDHSQVWYSPSEGIPERPMGWTLLYHPLSGFKFRVHAKNGVCVDYCEISSGIARTLMKYGGEKNV
tara:strand:+ start:410 stop:685 length:276 start_codon:yes stop_codon:yes gene_type:complete